MNDSEKYWDDIFINGKIKVYDICLQKYIDDFNLMKYILNPFI